ncbi:hypothetical protein CYMTET_27420, partial [Cymbomonas tetramitiformis]
APSSDRTGRTPANVIDYAEGTPGVLASGGSDGLVRLWDERSQGCLGTLEVLGEVNETSFSSCATYLQASSTNNYAVIYDVRRLSAGPLHVLSHGPPASVVNPTNEDGDERDGPRGITVRPNVVDEGDQGINTAQWFEGGTRLVTGSGNSSVAVWDVALGDPMIHWMPRDSHTYAHRRSVNSIAIKPGGHLFASGGDEQKILLYDFVRPS